MNLYERMKLYMMLLDKESGGNSGGGDGGGNTDTSPGKEDGKATQDADKKIEMTTAQFKERLDRELRKLAKTPAELAALLDEDTVGALLEQDGVKTVLDKRSAKEKAKSQGEFEKLYQDAQAEGNKHKTKAEKLEGEVTAMTAVLEATVKERRKLLPTEYHELLDALPLLKRLEWLTKNADKLQQGGVPGTQKIGSNGMTKEQKADQDAAYAQYYGRI
jgi:hypothetical protein